MQGAQKLRSEAHLQVRRNDEVAAQRSRWTFYETIKYETSLFILRSAEKPPAFPSWVFLLPPLVFSENCR
jgi:hypothetical protein